MKRDRVLAISQSAETDRETTKRNKTILFFFEGTTVLFFSGTKGIAGV
jgi:hypothetical protein